MEVEDVVGSALEADEEEERLKLFLSRIDTLEYLSPRYAFTRLSPLLFRTG